MKKSRILLWSGIALLIVLLVLAVFVLVKREGKRNPVETEPIHNHTVEILPGKAATCTEPGLTEGKKCSVCGELLSAQEEIPAKGHTVEILLGKAATCTEPGLTEEKKCSVCGELLSAQEVIPAKGHTEEVLPGKAATCTVSGLTEGKKCSVCGKTTVMRAVVPAQGHVFENGVCKGCGAITGDNLVFLWKESEQGYSVFGMGNCWDKDICIPSTHNGKPVTSIDDRAFYSCYYLTSIVIPESVTSIGNEAFSYCEKLTSLVIPKSVTSISSTAFSD